MIVQDNLRAALDGLAAKHEGMQGLSALRVKALEAFHNLATKDKRAVGFDYVQMKALTEALKNSARNSEDTKRSHQESYGITLVNGSYVPEKSSAPCAVFPLASQHPFKPWIQKWGMETVSSTEDPFVAYNYSLESQGVILVIDQKLDRPLKIVNIWDELHQENLSARVYIVVRGEGDADIAIEHRVSPSGPIPFHMITSCQIEKNCRLAVHETTEKGVCGMHFHDVAVKEGARFSYHLINPLAQFFRSHHRVKLLEPSADAQLFALNISSGEDQAHFFASLHHLAESTTSYQHVKTMSFGASRTSFEGKIFVDRPAQKTRAYQLNHNLVLSEKAHHFSKPNLEILADDVKASHGATFTRLSPEERFYLKSRGIDDKMTQQMLIKSFTQDVIDAVKHQGLQKEFQELIDRVVSQVL
jgi:Fe-S cluster assembly protein SufD